uniref:Tetraspanin-1 n=1 Tax=Schistocephalus solidus TaxID=70667 RepID=A0A0X3PJ75_SCHSO
MDCNLANGLRFLLVLFNLLLMVLFLILMVFGFLIRFSPNVVSGYMQQLLDKSVPEETAENLVVFFMQNSLPICLTLILFGLICALFCLLGALASCCGCRMPLKFYAAILAVLIIAQSVGVGVVFGTDTNLQNTVDALMMRTLQGSYVFQNADTPGVYVWFLIMTSKNVTCCGMNGYKDFATSRIPSPCCSAAVNTMPANCAEAEAKTANRPGCRTRINEFVQMEKRNLLIVPVIFILIQVIMFGITVAMLCFNSISPI